MKYIIGTGYHNETKRFGEWYEINAKGSEVYVIDCSQHYTNRSIDWVHFIPVENLGHVNSFPPNLSGWSVSVLLLALLAYNNRSDLVYIEEDCYTWGPKIDYIYGQAEQKEKLMLFGHGPQDGVEQSFFLIKYDYLLKFVYQYLLMPDRDYPTLPEIKFKRLMNQDPQNVGQFDLLGGRCRPIDFTASVGYIQHCTKEEFRRIPK